MTLGELERLWESKKRVQKRQLQERATFDYVLADLIGRSVARVCSSSNKMPELKEAYSTLFINSEELKEIEQKKQEQLDELSAIRFRQFATSHNKKFEEVQIDK